MAVNYDLTQTGQEVQINLDQVMPNWEAIQEEVRNREDADLAVRRDMVAYTDAEKERAQGVEAGLQSQIDEIIGGGATVNLTASPSTVFVGIESEINLNATASVNATSISITGGSIAEPITGSGKALIGTDTLTPSVPGVTTYTATFVISRQSRTAAKNVTAVYPVYYGSGMAESDVLDVEACKASARTSPTGTYTVSVVGSAKYIWFFVPANMTGITSAKMNGFDFPLENLDNTTDGDGVEYRVYRTPYTQEINSYSIDINK